MLEYYLNYKICFTHFVSYTCIICLLQNTLQNVRNGGFGGRNCISNKPREDFTSNCIPYYSIGIGLNGLIIKSDWLTVIIKCLTSYLESLWLCHFQSALQTCNSFDLTILLAPMGDIERQNKTSKQKTYSSTWHSVGSV